MQRAALRGVMHCRAGPLQERCCGGPGSAERHFAPHRVRDTERSSHRLDLHLTKFYYAGAVLQSDRSTGIVLGVLHVHGLLAVEHDDEM